MPSYRDRATKNFGIAPVRGTIVQDDLASANESQGELPSEMEFFFNPKQMDYVVGAEWVRIAVPGLSHEVLQWSHSLSNEVSFDVEWGSLEASRRLSGGHRGDRDVGAGTPSITFVQYMTNQVFLYKDFLHGLTVPTEAGRAPSRVSIIWPGLMHFTGVVEKVKFKFTQFAWSGEAMAFTAAIDMVEARVVFRQRNGNSQFFQDPQVPAKLDGDSAAAGSSGTITLSDFTDI